MFVEMLMVLFKNIPNQKLWKIRPCFIARGHDKFSHNTEIHNSLDLANKQRSNDYAMLPNTNNGWHSIRLVMSPNLKYFTGFM